LSAEDSDSVWSAAVDALLYFDGVVDAQLEASTQQRGRVDPRALVAMIERCPPSTCAESSVVRRRLVDLLAAGLNVDELTTTALDENYLDAAGGISVIARLYAECDCVASAERLFAVLYKHAAEECIQEQQQQQQQQKEEERQERRRRRQQHRSTAAASVAGARKPLLELLSHSQAVWWFRRVFSCLVPPASVFEEQLELSVALLARQSRSKDKAQRGAGGSLKFNEDQMELLRSIAGKLRLIVLSTFAESKEWASVMESAMADTGQLATQHERASCIRRLFTLLESPELAEQRTGQQLLFRLLCQAFGLDVDESGFGGTSTNSVRGDEAGRQTPGAQTAISVWRALVTATKPSARRIYIRIVQSLCWQRLLWSDSNGAQPQQQRRPSGDDLLGELNSRFILCVEAEESDDTNLTLIAQTLIELLWQPASQQPQQQRRQAHGTPTGAVKPPKTAATASETMAAAAESSSGSSSSSASLFRLFINGEVAIPRALARLVDSRILMHICRVCSNGADCSDVRMTAFLLLRDRTPCNAEDNDNDGSEVDLTRDLLGLCHDMLQSEEGSSRLNSKPSNGDNGGQSGARLWRLVGQTLLDLTLLLEPEAYWERMATIIAEAQQRNDLSLLSEPRSTAREMLRLKLQATRRDSM
jgi:hypothetical protein